MSVPTPAALVTGASRGLGRGVALQLAKEGFSVAIGFARNENAALEAAKHCSRNRITPDQRFEPVKADISLPGSAKSLVAAVLSRLGRIDLLVNNAGIAPRVRADITRTTEDSFNEVLQTNLVGPFFLTQEVANAWLAGTVSRLPGVGFKVVFVTSISAYTASVARGEYCVSKAGLSMARQLWAARLASEGIQVYEIRPGIMRTDMTEAVREKYDALIDEGLVPQRRWGTAQDVGLVVASIVRGNLDYCTGTVIDVDGGFSLRTL
jgi:NAD(P)-dependent dehydrogenase (short-subunit alcohol dehydrogenase family)